jgi:hypothetical protein
MSTPEKITFRVPRWAGGGDRVTAAEVRAGRDWLRDLTLEEGSILNGATTVPVFHLLSAVIEAMEEAEHEHHYVPIWTGTSNASGEALHVMRCNRCGEPLPKGQTS